VTAELEGTVVFRVGTPINGLWKVHEWLPVRRAMPGMRDDPEADPDRGILGDDVTPGVRNHEVVNDRRSSDRLRRDTLGPEARHAPSVPWTIGPMRESDVMRI
jgi:hypothetical protein